MAFFNFKRAGKKNTDSAVEPVEVLADGLNENTENSDNNELCENKEADEPTENNDVNDVIENNETDDNIENVEAIIQTEKKSGFFKKIMSALDKTKKSILSGVDNVLKSFVKIDDELFDELEEVLILSDIGAETAGRIIELLKDKVRSERVTDAALIKGMLAEVIAGILSENDSKLEINKPAVILVIGVNGAGKTTSIGKLAHSLKGNGNKVLLAAGDTFRAAAIEQLEVWAGRAGIDLIKHKEGSDPGAVIFDAVQAAKARKADVLICDTAGRLQNKKNLMDELKKIFKIIAINYSEAQLEVFLVLDATTGQNGLQQAKIFKEAANVTGIILTKLDSTAKGGIVIAVKNELNIPVRFIGVGEGIDDFQEFDAREFSDALFNA